MNVYVRIIRRREHFELSLLKTPSAHFPSQLRQRSPRETEDGRLSAVSQIRWPAYHRRTNNKSVRRAKSVCDRCMDAPSFTPGTDRQRDPKDPRVPGEKQCCGTRGDLCRTEFPALLLQREPARARYAIWPTYRDHQIGQRDASIDQDSSIRTARVSSGSLGHGEGTAAGLSD